MPIPPTERVRGCLVILAVKSNARASSLQVEGHGHGRSRAAGGSRSVRQVRQLCARGQLPAQKLGRDWFVKRKDAERFAQLPAGRSGRPRRLTHLAHVREAPLGWLAEVREAERMSPLFRCASVSRASLRLDR